MCGAHVRARTGDLFLTKEVLCQLSYVGTRRASPAVNGRLQCRRMGRSSTTIGQPGQIYAQCSRIWLTGASSVGKSLVGREGIEPPQSKTADLQSAELTTCSTYPRITAGAWCVDGGRWYQTDAAASTHEVALEPRRESPRGVPSVQAPQKESSV